ncbi:nucleotidyltransferase domain-containing protein [Patescibacteria group bacterium]|nr:nucleotidyltransferase domain-containing protein [Patescibacteria group bacterium]
MIKLGSKIAIKILGYYFLNPDKKHYVNELAGMLEADPGNLFRKLQELQAEGILVSFKQGNQKYFGLNKKYPLLKEIKKTYNVKYGLTGRLKEIASRIKNLKEAYIFGSYAKNSLQQESDIDILLIGGHSALEAKRKILPLQNEIKREINIIDLTPKEFNLRKRRKDEFIKNIFSNKIIKLL